MPMQPLPITQGQQPQIAKTRVKPKSKGLVDYMLEGLQFGMEMQTLQAQKEKTKAETELTEAKTSWYKAQPELEMSKQLFEQQEDAKKTLRDTAEDQYDQLISDYYSGSPERFNIAKQATQGFLQVLKSYPKDALPTRDLTYLETLGQLTEMPKKPIDPTVAALRDIALGKAEEPTGEKEVRTELEVGQAKEVAELRDTEIFVDNLRGEIYDEQLIKEIENDLIAAGKFNPSGWDWSWRGRTRQHPSMSKEDPDSYQNLPVEVRLEMDRRRLEWIKEVELPKRREQRAKRAEKELLLGKNRLRDQGIDYDAWKSKVSLSDFQ